MSSHSLKKTYSSTVIPGYIPPLDEVVKIDEADNEFCCVENDNLSLRNLEKSQLSLRTTVTIPQVASCCCRICLLNDGRECLISPCLCKGTLAYVHLSCLERWLNQNGRNYCELCQHHFNVIQTPRYRLSEALRLWVRHPRIRRHIQADIFISMLLTFVTMGLIVVCLLGMQYFVQEGQQIGIAQMWSTGAIGFFLTVVVLGYCITVYLLFKDQLTPWYRWWRRCVNVRLILDNDIDPNNLNVDNFYSDLQQTVLDS